jgi:bis(5'-nucleosyl)-tetraphosphatase (symmetrical)
MNRIILYGDIHGCIDEWSALRARLSPDPGDTEISVGDLVDRGPDSLACIRSARSWGISCIRGNHEHVYVRYAAHEERKRLSNKRNPMILTEEKAGLYESFAASDLEWLENLPIYLRMGGLTAVHGGVLPRLELGPSTPRHVLEICLWIRNLDERDKPVGLGDPRSCVRWSDHYAGSSGYIVYGHEPFEKPRIRSDSLGIDTGCVFGGSLTAAVFTRDARGMPLPIYSLVSESCHRRSGYSERMED